MKTKKIVALMLSLTMVLGVVAACSKKDSDDTTAADAATSEDTAAPAASDDETEPAASDDETEPAASDDETEPAAPAGPSYTELEVATVADEGDTVLVYGWNEEFPGLVTKYWADGDDSKFQLEITNSDNYQTKLDQVLASGEDAPDIFAADADWAKRYLASDNAMPVNSLGIAYDELSDMYEYTKMLAADDNGIIRGVAWQGCPSGVFYNRTVAEATLGVSEPEDVQKYFESWDAVLETAREVNTASEGKVKAISGTDDLWRAFHGARKTGWIVDGAVNVDPALEQYMDIAKTMYDEGLTFETSQWGDTWTAGMSNETVLSYWGPMWLARFSMGLADQDDGTGSNPTSGSWGLVLAPNGYYWGGTWVMASKYCDNKASVAEIMRAVCLDPANLDEMAKGGEFVNSMTIMSAAATSADYNLDMLGGQNAFAVLAAGALTIDNSIIGTDDKDINDSFSAVVSSYLSGDYATIADAEDAFEADLATKGII